MKHLMKKAVKAAVFAALTTLALTAFASAEGEMAIGAGCTTGTSLRMRSEPNTSSAIVTTLNKSVAVALLDDSVPGNWGGFAVTPTRFEFWQGRENRLHDRFLYTLCKEEHIPSSSSPESDGWRIVRLAP